jgi:UDP-N-acetylmuramate dehydrogenase
MNYMNIYDQLKNILGEANIKKDDLMKNYTSFKVGGPADIVVEPDNMDMLIESLRCLYSNQSSSQSSVPYMVIGNGSNIIFRDGGYRGVIVIIGQKLSQTKLIDAESKDGNSSLIKSQSGILLSTLARQVAAQSFSGMEFASGIPGSLGGAVFMNAGAYGGEIKDILHSVKVYSPETDKVEDFKADDLDLSYRHSNIQGSNKVILEATIKLSKGDKEKIHKTMSELTIKRNTKQPVNMPSAGSFFKRPEGYYAGKLIEDSGLKGASVGGAQISELHSGFMVNTGGATSKDIENLMVVVKETVYDKYKVHMEPEVRIVGDACE